MKHALLALLLAFPALAQVADQATPPAPAAPRQPHIPQPVERKLANGMRVIVVETHEVPLVSARLMILAGSAAESSARAGLASTTADLLTKGTKTKSAEEIARGVEALGATLEANAGVDATNIDANVMSSHLADAMAFVADVVRNPTFKQDELERERQQTLDQLEVELHDPQALSQQVVSRVVFGAGAYGHGVSGTPQTIKRITRDEIVAFHRRWYRPDNAVLVLAGEVTPNDAFALAEKLFGSWKNNGPKPAATAPKPLPKTSRVVVIDMPEAGQAAVVVARAGLRRADPQYFSAVVANAVLGGGYSARLNEEIRIKRGLSYGASSMFDFRRDIGPFTASAQTKNESAAEVAGIIVDEMNRLAASEVAGEELTARKAVVIGSFARALERSSGIVQRIATLALYGLPLNEVSTFIGSVQGISPQQVQSFAKSGLAGGAVDVVIVGNAKAFIEPLKKRFKNVEVIPAAKVDLNSATLRKAA